MVTNKTVVIIGAGPAGLTAAYELIKRGGYHVVVLEKSRQMGGISATMNYKGNRMDIGGHRFFSKSDWVMNWWLSILPLQRLSRGEQAEVKFISSDKLGPDPEVKDKVMLLRQRRSRIYWQRKFFDYPLKLNFDLVVKLGLVRVTRVGMSYLFSVFFPIRHEKNLEHFFINRFGGELYRTFFKSYTEKLWGVPCREISAAWGAQRIKGLNMHRALWDFVQKLFKSERGVRQEGTEISLIDQFLYPKYGPGQMWDEVARLVVKGGGDIITGVTVDRLRFKGRQVVMVEAEGADGMRKKYKADAVFSTMPIQELIRSMDVNVPSVIKEISEGLQYRDFITVGLLVKKLKLTEKDGSVLKDNWLYIQEPEVKVGRVQIFNNWSEYMVADPDNTTWLGLEYFCDEGDELWQLNDEDMISLAKDELVKIGIIVKSDALDATVIRVPKAYPAYFGTYERFGELRSWLDGFDNLYLLGRNGMHRYNNQDHSMLTAVKAVEHVMSGRGTKSDIWRVNEEKEYHEEK